MIDNLFLCVGAQKAGTTWLNAQLNDHPEIAFSDVKEVHYFNTIHNASVLLTRRKVEHIKRIVEKNPYAVERYYASLSAGLDVDPGLHRLFSPVNDEWYVSLFSKHDKKYSADFSPEYALIGQKGFDNVKRVSKKQKIIFMMRDPIDRAKSAIKYYYKMRGEVVSDKSSSEILSLANSDLIIGMSSYEKTIIDLSESFVPSQILYLFYEDVMSNKQLAIDQVCEFLCINKIAVPEEKLDRRVNVTESFDLGAAVEVELRKRLVNTYEYVNANFNVPKSWNKYE